MTTIKVFGPGCEMVAFMDDEMPRLAVRRDRIVVIEPVDGVPKTLVLFEAILGTGKTKEIDMPFDAVLGLLNYGTPYHTEPANASQRGD